MTTLAPHLLTSVKGKTSMRTVAFNSFPINEREDFISSCRRWRRNPEAFLVNAEEEDDRRPSTSASPVRRDVIVMHVASGKARRYHASYGSNWNAAFEDDLQALFFANMG